ncbi:hypothetical protein OIO90_002116 [Microbotryomycetes sp. JL221]|nr:hypothetical protein OIO90_002116 [Microbotryomycetes sp. JL221]
MSPAAKRRRAEDGASTSDGGGLHDNGSSSSADHAARHVLGDSKEHLVHTETAAAGLKRPRLSSRSHTEQARSVPMSSGASQGGTEQPASARASSLASPSLHDHGFRSGGVKTRPSTSDGGSSHVGQTSSAQLTVDGFRDVRIVNRDYEDVVSCRALSSTSTQSAILKFSCNARGSAHAQLKAEANMMYIARTHGATCVPATSLREIDRIGTTLVIEDSGLLTMREAFELQTPKRVPCWTNPIKLAAAIRTAINVVKALGQLHSQHIVHASIRPSNILVRSTSPFEVELLDFSCAFRTGSEGAPQASRERGMQDPSLPYLAPECLGRVAKTVDYRSDFYSVGVTLFELFTGTLPFASAAADPLEIIHAHAAKRPALMNTLDSSIPVELTLTIAKLLEKSPDARYQTTQGLIFDLAQVLELVRRRRSVGPDSDVDTLSVDSSPKLASSILEPSFVVGNVDEAAHFRLPPASRMYGREKDIKALQQRYERVKATNVRDVVVVKGNSGIGKSCLVETVRSPVVKAGGFYTAVKFDQIKSPVPFYAITQALSSLLRQILSEPEAKLVSWRRRLERALGKEGRVLADLMPSLETVFKSGWIESLPPVVPLGATESEERFQSVVQRVFQIFARPGKPLVLVFDDLQWSTAADLNFILRLLEIDDADDDAASRPILLICVYRDNEVNPDHVVETVLLRWLPSDAIKIKLEPLNINDIKAFVSEALRQPIGLGKREDIKEDTEILTLSDLILQRTGGSPLFVAQLLKALNAEGVFSFDFERARWTFDFDTIAAKSFSTDVAELLQAQMRKFGPATRHALITAACLGNEDLSATLLATAAGCEPDKLAIDLKDAVEEGMLMSVGSDEGSDEGGDILANLDHITASKDPRSYRFFHDRCQQAAYALVPQRDRRRMHYEIGQRLVAAVENDDALYDRIFDLANQLNNGVEILSTTQERDKLAEYNLLAATKATRATAFEAARKYLQIAWDLLGPGGWVGQPELMGKVTEALVEVEYSLTDYQASQEYVHIFLEHSRDQIAKLRVYARSIRSASASGDSLGAIRIGREGLAMVGIPLPDDGQVGQQLANEIRQELHLTVEQIEGLIDQPRLTDPIIGGAQQLLAALIPPVYFTRIDLLPALTALTARATFKYGIDDAGALMFTLHAVIVKDAYNAPSEAMAYGQVAVQYFVRYGGSPLACPTYKVYASHVAPWASPIRDSLSSFRKSIAYGIEYRDAEYVGFGCGELCAYNIAVIHQSTLCLTGRSAQHCEIEGEAFTTADFQIVNEKQYQLIHFYYHMIRLIIAVIFNDKSRANESAIAGRGSIAGGQGLIYTTFFEVFEAVQLYDRFAELTDAERTLMAGTKTMLETLSQRQAHNFLPLKQWLEAEATRVAGDTQAAIVLYETTIASALASEYGYIAAIVNERCARMLDSPRMAAGYLLEARDLWQKWGCMPKVLAMEAEHPTLFRPSRTSMSGVESADMTSSLHPMSSAGAVLSPGPSPLATPQAIDDVQEPIFPAGAGNGVSVSNSNSDSHSHEDHTNSPTNGRESVAALHKDSSRAGGRRTSTGSHGSQSHSASDAHEAASDHRSLTAHNEVISRSHLATELDLRTVVSASGIIAMELSVDGVVAKLLSLALRTAGAEMCLLVLDKNGKLCAEAIARSDSNDTEHLRRMDAIDRQPDRYPCSVINYVARSKEMVVNSLDELGDSISDPYLHSRKPASILCLALANQQRVIGVLYMENSQIKNAFTPDRLEILSLISGQAASTIEKARLVQDLKSANADLQRSQAALEDYNRGLESTVATRTQELRRKNELLVAEVAEKELAQAEMRSAKEIAESATQMKSQFLANMSHEIRTPFNAVVALASLLLDTSLTPVQTDYVETIKNSSQELLVVINDILDYSKIELDHLELSQDTVQLRQVLESSMDMLAERAATKSVELALIIEQGDISFIGDMTRLRQIVVNLLSNAVKFTSNGEITVTARALEIAKSPNGHDMCKIVISVKDSGIGIAKEHFGRLFRVFSQAEGSETTKQFGGTGLGLAISRKLSRLMGGDITVESEVGKGSTFTVTIIARLLEARDTDVYSTRQNPDLVGKRCLIVDANPTNRTVLKQLVTSFGLAVEAPDHPADAYVLATAAHDAGKPYDVFIVDAFLPDFAAQILLRRLRQKGINAPAIALTRMGSPIYEEMRQLDCRFLIKPIKRNRLHHTLRQVFPATPSKDVCKKPSTPQPQKEQFPSNFAASHPLTILCAEDNPINVKVITHLLKRIGYTTDIAEDGLIALEKAQKKKYDIIFMDVNMPRMDGLEATREIVKIMPEPATRPWIVCLTANAMTGDREKCLAAGGDGYISKPVLVPPLVEALKAASEKAMRQRGIAAGNDGTHIVAPISVTSSSSKDAAVFELELPTSRLGRATRAGSTSNRGGTHSAPRSGASSPARSPDATPPGSSSGSK